MPRSSLRAATAAAAAASGYRTRRIQPVRLIIVPSVDLIRSIPLDRLGHFVPVASRLGRAFGVNRLRIDGLNSGVVFHRFSEERILVADVRVGRVAGVQRKG